MPCYDVVIDAEDLTGNTIVVGSEFGVFVTQDGGDSWTISNEGMSTEYDALAAPVFDLKQQFRASKQWSNITKSGAIYAGTTEASSWRHHHRRWRKKWWSRSRNRGTSSRTL